MSENNNVYCMNGWLSGLMQELIVWVRCLETIMFIVWLVDWVAWCRSSSATDPSAQECLQLVVRATQVFREEYIQKFEQAREEIARRYWHLFTSHLVMTFWCHYHHHSWHSYWELIEISVKMKQILLFFVSFIAIVRNASMKHISNVLEMS